MRVVALTSFDRGFASLAVDALARTAGVEIACVVLSRDEAPDVARARRRRIEKARHIGLLGALNGIRMRRWYSADAVERVAAAPLREVAGRHGIPLEETPYVGSDRTLELFRGAYPRVGLSLGTGYIPRRVFEIPTDGMLNVHHELLPDYPGAQSVIWPLHDGRAETGYTIHLIDESLDGGPILLRESRPIRFERTLRATVTANYAESWLASVDGLRRLLERWPEPLSEARPNPRGAGYTTPTARQFLRMLRMHRRLAVDG